VKDVRSSVRLADSPSCIVADEDDPTLKMAQMMKAMGQAAGMPAMKPILEVNPDHAIIKRLADVTDEAQIADAAWLLLDQALLIEGVPLENPAEFVQRLNRVLGKAI
jgi:molecular chaperone HtpG